MKERIVNQIIQGMLSVLNNAQTAHLQKVLAAAFSEVEVITVDCSETRRTIPQIERLRSCSLQPRKSKVVLKNR